MCALHKDHLIKRCQHFACRSPVQLTEPSLAHLLLHFATEQWSRWGKERNRTVHNQSSSPAPVRVMAQYREWGSQNPKHINHMFHLKSLLLLVYNLSPTCKPWGWDSKGHTVAISFTRKWEMHLTNIKITPSIWKLSGITAPPSGIHTSVQITSYFKPTW